MSMSINININSEDDPSHQDHHQEPQEDVDVPDKNFPLNTISIIYFWKPQEKTSSMKMIQTIMIIICNLRRMGDVLQVSGGS